MLGGGRNARRKVGATDRLAPEGHECSTYYPPFSTQSELPVITLAMNNPTIQKDLSTSIEEAWLRRSVYGTYTLKTDDLENEGRSDHPFVQTGHSEFPLNASNNRNGFPLSDTCGQRNVVRRPPTFTMNSVPTSLTGQNSPGYPTRKTNSSPQRQRAGSSTVPARSPTCVTFAVASAPRPSSLRSALSPNFRKEGDLGKVSKSQGLLCAISHVTSCKRSLSLHLRSSRALNWWMTINLSFINPRSTPLLH